MAQIYYVVITEYSHTLDEHRIPEDYHHSISLLRTGPELVSFIDEVAQERIIARGSNLYIQEVFKFRLFPSLFYEALLAHGAIESAPYHDNHFSVFCASSVIRQTVDDYMQHHSQF